MFLFDVVGALLKYSKLVCRWAVAVKGNAFGFVWISSVGCNAASWLSRHWQWLFSVVWEKFAQENSNWCCTKHQVPLVLWFQFFDVFSQVWYIHVTCFEAPYFIITFRSLQEKRERDAAFQKQQAFLRLEREDSVKLSRSQSQRLPINFQFQDATWVHLQYINHLIYFNLKYVMRHCEAMFWLSPKMPPLQLQCSSLLHVESSGCAFLLHV